MALDMLSMALSQGYTDEIVIGGGALKGKNCVVSNIEEVADGVNVTFQWTLDDGTVKTDTAFIPRGTQGEAGVAGKSAYEIWLEAGNTGTEEDFFRTVSSQLSSEIVNVETQINSIATFREDIELLQGVGEWTQNNQFNIVLTNINRITADLSNIVFSNGDIVGLRDYSTYKFAVGTNNAPSMSPTPWIDEENGAYKSTNLMLTNETKNYAKVVLFARLDNADMTQSDYENIYRLFFTSNGEKTVSLIGKSVNKENLNFKLHDYTRNYIHISFDDVESSIANLLNNVNTFNSIFDEPFFAKLKDLHERYGACFSLYVWKCSSILANATDKFASEFIANSDWLKFGFHSDTLADYSTATKEQVIADYNNFIEKMLVITGGVNSIDRIPRLHMYKGNKETCEALRDCNCGIYGLLSADDTRYTYYLTDNQKNYLRNHSKLIDLENGLLFYSTNIRLDWFNDDFTSDYQYKAPVKNNPYEELVYRYGTSAFCDLFQPLIVFTHEWEVYNENFVILNDKFSRVEQVCKFANDYNFAFDYPMDRESSGIASVIVK